jgi:hypothetical protein
MLKGYDSKAKIHQKDPHKTKVQNILHNQKRTYKDIFLEEPDFDTDKFHYDWWQFPLPLPEEFKPSDTAVYYSINCEETNELLQNEKFKERYLECIEDYLEAQEDRWNEYHIRFIKVTFSLWHFIQFTENSVDHQIFHEEAKKLGKRCLELNDLHFIEDDPYAEDMGNKEYDAINRLQSFFDRTKVKYRP